MKEIERGIRLQTLQIVMLGISVLLAVVLIITALRVQDGYKETQQATDRYAQSLRDASAMEEASDYLTLQARAFAATADLQYMKNYFEEINVSKRRDNAIDNIQEIMGDTIAFQYMTDALQHSEELEHIEYYSMRLVLEAKGVAESEWPQEVLAEELSPQDAALSAEKKMDRASEVLYDELYRSYKDSIYQSIEKCTGDLVDTTQKQQMESAEHLSTLLRHQFLLIGISLMIVFVIVLLTFVLIIRPMETSVQRINNQERLPENGAYEMRFLARTYNEMFDENEKHHVKLSYEASHDALTGLYNRGAFDKMRKTFDELSIALLLIDVDYFKTINDTYGHDGGDAALRNVGMVLRDAFRAEDRVCRIGGDEFAVIMVNVSSSLEELVRKKIETAAVKLQNPPKDVPPVTLSVGVAFGDREEPTGDIYKDADTALYKTKEAGRNGITFYGEQSRR